MLIGSVQYRLGYAAKGEQIYREVYQKTTGKDNEVDKALHHASSQALERLHPEQKFP
jgi:hypothetical protein